MEPVVSYPSFDCRIWSHWRRWYAITRPSWPCFTITPRSRGRGLASCLAWCLVALVVIEPGVYGVFLERIASPTYCWLPHPGALYFGIEYVTICCGGQIYIPLCVAPYNRALGHILVEEAADRSPLWDLRSEQDLIWDLSWDQLEQDSRLPSFLSTCTRVLSQISCAQVVCTWTMKIWWGICNLANYIIILQIILLKAKVTFRQMLSGTLHIVLWKSCLCFVWQNLLSPLI